MKLLVWSVFLFTTKFVSGSDHEKQHVGCFNDTATHEDLPHQAYSNDKHNQPSTCIHTCRSQGYWFAGLQNGHTCFCGNNPVRAFGESKLCSIPCPGNSALTCGGTMTNDVYRVPKDPRYLGCYNDGLKNPELPHKIWDKSEGKPAHQCIDKCAIKGMKFAGVQDGGDCYCGNSYGGHGAANETECDTRCHTYGAENCGGLGVNAIYQTNLAYDFSNGGIDPRATKLYNKDASAITLSLFTTFPYLRSITTKSLVIHSSTEIKAPADDIICSKGCYSPCSEIQQNDQLLNKGKDVHLRFFYLRLSELHKYVGTHAQRVWVHAQTVVIDVNLDISYALSVRTRELFINRATASYITTSTSNVLHVDFTGVIPDPEPDLLHLKQTLMCSRILYETYSTEHHLTAWAMVSNLATINSKSPEVAMFSSSVRTIRAEMAGMASSNVHFVPFYTKTHIATIMEAYAERIKVYKEEQEKVETAIKNKKEFIGFTKEMHLIYTTTDITEAQMAFEASRDALIRSNATYHRFKKYYEEARLNLEVAHEKFEQALNESDSSSFKNFVSGFKNAVSQVGLGILRISLGDIPGGVGNIIGSVDTLFDTIYNLAATIRQINQMMEFADAILDSIQEAEDNNKMIGYMDDIEMMVQLEVNLVLWNNLKSYGLVILEDKEVINIEGCAAYKRALLDFANWGEALTRSMVESAELSREAIKKKLNLQIKLEQRQRITNHFKEFENDVSKQELVLWDMIEQTHDVRLDMNNLLLTFCQAFFYENMKQCKDSYKPSFGGSLDGILLKINYAKNDDLLNPGVGSTLARIVEIKDINTDDNCIDATVCPINYLRKNRILFFNISADHPELRDIDKYKVSRINLTFVGAKGSSVNQYLKVGIESSGKFMGRSEGNVYNFRTRALTLTHEYNVVSGHVSIHADVYQPFRNIIQHITPYTVWVMRVSEMRSMDIVLSSVTKVKIGFDGFGKVSGRYRSW